MKNKITLGASPAFKKPVLIVTNEKETKILKISNKVFDALKSSGLPYEG